MIRMILFSCGFVCYHFSLQMLNTLRDHKDNVGGIFNTYDLVKVQKIRNKKLLEKYQHRRKEVRTSQESFLIFDLVIQKTALLEWCVCAR